MTFPVRTLLVGLLFAFAAENASSAEFEVKNNQLDVQVLGAPSAENLFPPLPVPKVEELEELKEEKDFAQAHELDKSVFPSNEGQAKSRSLYFRKTVGTPSFPAFRASGFFGLVLTPDMDDKALKKEGASGYDYSLSAVSEDVSEDDGIFLIESDGYLLQGSLSGWKRNGKMLFTAKLPFGGHSGDHRILMRTPTGNMSAFDTHDLEASLGDLEVTASIINQAGKGVVSPGLVLKAPTGDVDDLMSTGELDAALRVSFYHPWLAAPRPFCDLWFGMQVGYVLTGDHEFKGLPEGVLDMQDCGYASLGLSGACSPQTRWSMAAHLIDNPYRKHSYMKYLHDEIAILGLNFEHFIEENRTFRMGVAVGLMESSPDLQMSVGGSF